MSTLRPPAVIPLIVMVAGTIVSASESPAAARERHSAGATKASATAANSHHARAAHGGVHQAAQNVTPESGGGTHRHSHQVADRAAHRIWPHAAHRDVVHEVAHSFSGFASFYSESQRLASGGTFNPSGYTCAHRTLPFGTHLRVADPKSGRSVVVTVNDRGPFVGGRILDLSLGAARALGMTGRGVMRVDARVI
jgi:rare lipoprotein A